MAELLAKLLDCEASNRVRTGTDLSELEPPSKKRKTGKFSSENERGADDGSRNDDRRILAKAEIISTLLMFRGLLDSLSSENEGGVDDSRSNDDGRMSHLSKLVSAGDSRSNDDGWMGEDSHELGQLALFPMELEPPFSGKSSSAPPPHLRWLDLCLGTCDAQVSIQNWNKLESNGSLDREDNHDNRASSENEDRLLNCRSYDDLPLKLTLPVSSTEIGKESNEINGVEGSCEVHPVAGKCPVQHQNAVQLLPASSSNSDCLDVNLRMEGRHPSPLLLWLRNTVLKPLHLPDVGTIFGNLKHDNVLMTDQLFSTRLSYIKNNKMDPSLLKSIPEVEDLSLRLSTKNPDLRPEAREVLLHPFSWSSKFKLHFLRQMHEMLVSKIRVPRSVLVDKLESKEPPVFYGDWIDELDPTFKAYILRRKEDGIENLDGSSVRGIVRCMRNNSVHLPQLPRHIKRQIGWNDEEIYNYFAARFPSLFMKFYGAASHYCRNDRWFKELHKEILKDFLRKGCPVTLGHW